MENYKNKLIESEQLKTLNKIEGLKRTLKEKDFKNLTWFEKESLTTKQYNLLISEEKADQKKAKELIKRQIIKEKEKLQEQKEKAIEKYNNIKQLKDIKSASFEIVWSEHAGSYGFQCYCNAFVTYANGETIHETGDKTRGCGYDKPSSALSYVLSKVGKILLLKNDKKIINNNNRHYDCYACENLYFSYGVGLSTYETMFKYFGYKVKTSYLKNENVLITIKK